MNSERFETLAEAFGGDVARWPDAEHEAAAALMITQPDWAAVVLARAGCLDAALSANAPHRGSMGLVDRIASRAPQARPGRGVSWLLPVGLGAGLAAACAAGVMVGAQVAPALAPPAADESLMTVMGDLDFGLDLDEAA